MSYTMSRPKKIASGSPRGLAGSRVTRPPFLRMLRIHELLSAARAPNCSVLAREFEVSAKTVQRDVDFMRDQLMLPIEYRQPRAWLLLLAPGGSISLDHRE